MGVHPQAMERLIGALTRLPTVGRRTAERMAFGLIEQGEVLLPELLDALNQVRGTLGRCSRCGAITSRERNPCDICTDSRRDATLCVVEDAASVLAIERSGGYRGRYHVLAGKLSPMSGVGPRELRVEALRVRLREEGIGEVFIALSTDVESDATAGYLAEQLAETGVRVTRLAFGLPAGSGIEYADSVTLARAIRGRTALHGEASAT